MIPQPKQLQRNTLRLVLWIVDALRPFGILLGLSLVFSSFFFWSWASFLLGLLLIFEPFRLGAKLERSESMAPTLMPGDIVFLDPLSVFWRGRWKRGEIVLFRRPKILGEVTESVHRLCKRVIGLPGDRIRVVRGIGVSINDQILDESSYVKEAPNYNLAVLGDIGGLIENKQFFPYKDGAESGQAIVVPPGHLFILGDNRNNSLDSHHFGFVEQRTVVGRILGAWRLQQRPQQTATLYCSFCQSSQKEVKKLISGPPGTYICDKCVLFCEISLRTKGQADQVSSQKTVCSFCNKSVKSDCIVGQTDKICSECLDICKEIILEKSIEDCSKAIAQNSTDANAYAARAHAYAQEMQYTKAIGDWDKAIDLNPANAEYYLRRGNNYSHLSQYERALEDFSTAIRLNSKLIDAYSCRAFAKIQLNRFEEALLDSDSAIFLDQENAVAHNNRGKALLLLGRLQEALPHLDKAIALNSSTYPIFFYNRGYVRQALGQYEVAISDYTKALEMDPKLNKAYESRAETYEAMGQHDLAALDREKVKALPTASAEA